MTTILSKSKSKYPYIELKAKSFAVPKVSLMVGIAVSNEEQNIGALLENLTASAPPEVETICVVSSGSTDQTNSIIRSFAEDDARIQLIIEPERTGKASALNLLLEQSQNYDYMVYTGGDNIPCREALNHLLAAIRSQDVDIVGAHPRPVDDPHCFMGFCTHLLWNLHHDASLGKPKISGELMVFKSRIIRELPPAIINDDAYIQALGEMKKYKISYCPQAEVLLKGPSNVHDFLAQRRRVFVGHQQLEFLIGKKVSTMKVPSWKSILKACPYRGLKGRVYAAGFVFFQAVAFLLAKWDFARHNLPVKWTMAKSTKNLFDSKETSLLAGIAPVGLDGSLEQ
ncbi:MAG: glycosyltransferase [Candidatus Bathyarchaeota archaeon]|nr:glycosyltransferase [Candidatus Bathyarchaeota archaeon]